MNRVIKFRGKRLDNGEWYYGDLVENQGSYFLYHATSETTLRDSDASVVILAFGVFTNTVGQYTGLKDKYGREIYEGDIVAIDCGGVDAILPVSYKDGAFVLIDDDTLHDLISEPSCNIAIVGNIHDKNG